MIYYIVNSNITPTIYITSSMSRDNSIVGCIKGHIDMFELNVRLRDKAGYSQDQAHLKRLIQLRILLMLIKYCELKLNVVQQNFC